MPATRNPRTPRARKPSGKTKLAATNSPLPSQASLKQLSADKVATWFRAESTSDNYKRYVKEGKEWVLKWAASMKDVEESNDAENSIESRVIAGAFDTICEHTPKALHAFVVFKCGIQDNSYKTAEGIRSAFKHYFTYTHGCQGDFWKKNKTSGEWDGNPVFDLSYSSYHESLKKEYQRAGDSSHSLPMLPKDLEKMFAYADHASANKTLSVTSCLFWKAFASVAFTLWTRCDEAINLTGESLQLRLEDERDGMRYHQFTLTWRKTNQDNPDKSNEYKIPEGDTSTAAAATDCFTHTLRWVQHLEKEMQRPLQKNDFLFPAIASTGKLKIGTAVGRTEIEKMLTYFVARAELLSMRPGKFTTHCFRRGGAQWCFMWRPDRKWSLKAVKWWGGWSPTESVTTLTRYLLDEVCKYEHGYGDMLMPNRSYERHVTFMGDAPPDPAETSNGHGVAVERHTDFDNPVGLAQVLAEIRAERQQVTALLSLVQSGASTHSPGGAAQSVVSLATVHPNEPLCIPIQTSLLPSATVATAAALSLGSTRAEPREHAREIPFRHTRYNGIGVQNLGSPTLTTAVPLHTANGEHTLGHRPSHRSSTSRALHRPAAPFSMTLPDISLHNPQNPSVVPPIDPTKLRIPDTHSLDDCLRYWDKGNESRGLLVPLHEWPSRFKPAQYRGEAVKWGKIRKVVEEFHAVCGSDREVFERSYPGLSRQYSKLVRAIDAEREHRNQLVRRPKKRKAAEPVISETATKKRGKRARIAGGGSVVV